MSDYLQSAEYRRLLELLRQLQDVFTQNEMTHDLKLPMICVIGGQSVGKSSVIESLVGIEFLPRGDGIVTRCPIIINCVPHADDMDDYACFQHKPNEHFPLEAARDEILAETEQICGKGKNISQQEIRVSLHSSRVIDITLVDLPGIIRAPADDQADDIEEQTSNLVKKMVSTSNVIILAVSDATSNMANSDAMKIVKEVDKKGDRTIGVLTKMDILQDSAKRDIYRVLGNKHFALDLGYVGVINKTEEEIKNKRSKTSVRQRERRVFEEKFSDVADRMGTPFLQIIVTRELKRRVEETLPQIKAKFQGRIKRANQQLEKYKQDDNPHFTLDRLLETFKTVFVGEMYGQPHLVDTKNLNGGARLNIAYYTSFIDHLKVEHAQIEEAHVKLAIRNAHALRNGTDIPLVVYEKFIKEWIEDYKEPTKDCVDEADRLIEQTVSKELEIFADYPNLKHQVREKINIYKDEQAKATKEYLMTYITAQGDFIDKDLVCGTLDTLPENSDCANSEVDELCHDELKMERVEARSHARADAPLPSLSPEPKVPDQLGSKRKRKASETPDKGQSRRKRSSGLSIPCQKTNDASTSAAVFSNIARAPSVEPVTIAPTPRPVASLTTSFGSFAHLNVQIGTKQPTLNSVSELNRRLQSHATSKEEESRVTKQVKEFVKEFDAKVRHSLKTMIRTMITHLLVKKTTDYIRTDMNTALRTQYANKLDELLARKEDIAREIEVCKMEQEKAVRALKFIDEFYRDKYTAI